MKWQSGKCVHCSRTSSSSSSSFSISSLAASDPSDGSSASLASSSCTTSVTHVHCDVMSVALSTADRSRRSPPSSPPPRGPLSTISACGARANHRLGVFFGRLLSSSAGTPQSAPLSVQYAGGASTRRGPSAARPSRALCAASCPSTAPACLSARHARSGCDLSQLSCFSSLCRWYGSAAHALSKRLYMFSNRTLRQLHTSSAPAGPAAPGRRRMRRAQSARASAYIQEQEQIAWQCELGTCLAA